MTPSQTPANDVMPTQNPANDVMPPTQNPANDVMLSQTPAANDLDPTSGGAGVSSERACSYRDLLTHLDLTNDTLLLKAVRPVHHYLTLTEVHLNVAVEAILDVVEKEQKLISRIFIQMKWHNEFLSWDPAEFCGIRRIHVPGEWLWKPDVSLDERLEDGAAPNPYVRLSFDGRVIDRNTEMIVSTCRMNVYKFPFDTQSCNLTFSSGIYRADELELKTTYDMNKTRFRSMSVLWGEYEWEFDNFTFVKVAETPYHNQQIVYTVTMKRKAVLYIVNFLLPVVFFLCLDMASFLIPDSGGEKLSFKITVLLAVTVLQLILNDILPATSNRMPIIAMYCIGTFFLMLLSLLETVVATYLLDKDSQRTETVEDKNPKNKTKGYNSCVREKRSKSSLCFYNVPDDGDDGDDDDDDGERETMHELQNVPEEDNNLKGESHGFQLVLDQLRALEKNLRSFLKSEEDGGRPGGYWTRMATRMNRAFFIFYVTTVVVFLAFIFSEWSPEY